jgi:hypothetical protein
MSRAATEKPHRTGVLNCDVEDAALAGLSDENDVRGRARISCLVNKDDMSLKSDQENWTYTPILLITDGTRVKSRAQHLTGIVKIALCSRVKRAIEMELQNIADVCGCRVGVEYEAGLTSVNNDGLCDNSGCNNCEKGH